VLVFCNFLHASHAAACADTHSAELCITVAHCRLLQCLAPSGTHRCSKRCCLPEAPACLTEGCHKGPCCSFAIACMLVLLQHSPTHTARRAALCIIVAHSRLLQRLAPSGTRHYSAHCCHPEAPAWLTEGCRQGPCCPSVTSCMPVILLQHSPTHTAQSSASS
jgi:hypothetical protein